jgi:hypothetical protein
MVFRKVISWSQIFGCGPDLGVHVGAGMVSKNNPLLYQKRSQKHRHVLEGNFSEFHTFAIDILYQNV